MSKTTGKFNEPTIQPKISLYALLLSLLCPFYYFVRFIPLWPIDSIAVYLLLDYM